MVKLIDVFPDEVPSQPELGGYQLAVSMDIFRGRYRESFEHPSAIPAGKPQRIPIRFAHHQPRVPAGASDHGADPIELVPAVRPEPADLRAQHFPRAAVGLSESNRDRVPLNRPGERDLAARGSVSVPSLRTHLCATLDYVKEQTKEQTNVTLSLPDNLLRRFRVFAATRNQSMSSLMTAAISDMIEQESQTQRARRRFLERIRNAPDRGTQGQIQWTRDELHER